MLKTIFTVILSIFLMPACTTQPGTVQNGDDPQENQGNQGKPKLIVGIVVDQMRYDYLERYKENFGEGGFNRFLKDGFVYENAHYNYVPTYTAPGHAAIYSGTTPAINGIIGNNWFDQQLNEDVYCAYDSTVKSVGADNANGLMSPHRLLASTFGDVLLEASGKQSKVVGISVKDRGAIFPAGREGKAYWFDPVSGNFISSTFYGNQLPQWLNNFNNRRLAESYMKLTWEPLMAIDKYTASDADSSAYEVGLLGKNTFPYVLGESSGFGIISSTPYGNQVLIELAKSAIEGEKLGTHEMPDFLSVSFSSTDYAGHNFGPNSMEVEDMYLRLDRSLAELFDYLDKKIGADQYLVFLSSDHGVSEVPKRMMDRQAGGGYLRVNIVNHVTEYLKKKFGHSDWVRASGNQQVYLNREKIKEAGLNTGHIRSLVAQHLQQVDGISRVYTYDDMLTTDYYAEGIEGAIRRGFNEDLSGDVMFVMESGWLQTGNERGTSHGSFYDYDTHVPVLWYGGGIPAGSSGELHSVTDIVPTLGAILNMPLPETVTGKPMMEVLAE